MVYSGEKPEYKNQIAWLIMANLHMQPKENNYSSYNIKTFV